MKHSIFRITTLTAAVVMGMAGMGEAQAAATIFNPAGTVALGVNDQGHLNTSVGSVAVNAGATGVSWKFSDGFYHDATSPGCLCEGWGVSVNSTNSGYANVSVDGVVNLTVDSFSSTPSTATSSVHLTDLTGLSVTQAYAPAAGAPNNLFMDHVTITNNTGSTVNDVKYVRVMDWDVPPTEFSEYVTIKGVATTTLLEKSGDNGFNSANPLASYANFDPACLDQDCTDSGVNDHGAYFRFNFGSLADGQSYSFDIFYGAAGTEADALAAIGAESIELFSLGQSSGYDNAGNPSQVSGAPATFIFGFAGVGGTPVEPPNPTPEPASLALLGLGLLGMGAARRRSKA